MMMNAAIVYESMFGNTRQIAEAIADGLGESLTVETFSVTHADQTVCQGIDLLVVGGPTHAWSMSQPSTRRGAPLHLSDPDSDLILEPGADWGPGVREWISTIDRIATKGAAFDTRLASPLLLTGRACKSIGRQLTYHGLTLIAPPESFLVDKKSHLLPGELDRALAWGVRLARQASRPESLNA